MRTTKEEAPPNNLPTPLTKNDSIGTRSFRDGTATPPEGRPSQIQASQYPNGASQLESPPMDTQPFSQLLRPAAMAEGVEDEENEGIWGYLIPLDAKFGDTLVLRRRTACPAPTPGSNFGTGGGRKTRPPAKDSREFVHEEQRFEERKAEDGLPSGGYLIGRHRECGTFASSTPSLLLKSLISEFRPCA